MRRIVLMISLLVVLGGVGVAVRVASAEDASNAAATSTALIPQTTLSDIYTKLDSIRRHQDDLKNVSKQLEQVLKNQDAIMADLQIIKVRTVRR